MPLKSVTVYNSADGHRAVVGAFKQPLGRAGYFDTFSALMEWVKQKVPDHVPQRKASLSRKGINLVKGDSPPFTDAEYELKVGGQVFQVCLEFETDLFE